MSLNAHDFSYILPDDRIARYPLQDRDQSKLLVYRGGEILHSKFHTIVDFLPEGSLLVFNDTKVIPARLHFKKDSGATIEIFLLTPVFPSSLVLEAMQIKKSCTWKCTIGNLKRWNDEKKLVKQVDGITIEAALKERENCLVTFSWSANLSFAEIVSLFGETPLPPYLKRKAEQSDHQRYQTIYAQHAGAVAAPTAGLHFTSGVLRAIDEKGVDTDYITLHVGAGTFLPIKAKDPAMHTMHTEQVVITRKNIEAITEHSYVTAVGTTSLRSLESLYWYGVKLLKNPRAAFSIQQEEPYLENEDLPSTEVALNAVLSLLNERHEEVLMGETSIYIVPGYTFRLCNALITNFHQPGSTLVLLIAAFIGKDWRKIYQEALSNEYRFLSYGDSSLLVRS